MSGLSQNARDELSSERNYEDRIPHYCNMLRFGILKKDNSFMAIGGPWDNIDGGDPSVDDSSLVQTATRYAKDVTALDLSNCRNWNRFLEIHYDRVGKDGHFSHKEVTVLYVPDLSECLPSLDAWRDQWLSHKKAVAERERQLALKKEKSREKKEGQKDKEPGSAKDPKKDGKSGKGKETKESGKEKVGDENAKKVGKKDYAETGGSISEKKEQTESASTPTPVKSGKKKIIKKIVKKVVEKKDAEENTTKQSDNLDDKDKTPILGATGQQDESSSTPAAVKTFARKKVAKKVQVLKSVQIKAGAVQAVEKTVKEPEDQAQEKTDTAAQEASAKTTVKKKIIKRVAKRKVSAVDGSEGGVTVNTKNGDKDVKTEEEEKGTDVDSKVKPESKTVPKRRAKMVPEKQDNVGSSSKTGKKNENDEKTGSASKMEKTEDDKKKVVQKDNVSKVEIEDDKKKVDKKDDGNGKMEKSKEREKSKDDKEIKDRDGKDGSKSNKEKEKKKADEPPRHPGFIVQTKGSKDSMIRSLSLSLDSLLDYSDKDLEESTFELSLFAETLYEMLQYQMGCRLLTFLQKLRIKFVTKRNQRKRQREISEKENEKKSSTKRPKTEAGTMETELIKIEKQDETNKDDEKTIVKEEKTSNDDEVAKVKTEGETDQDEDPEEDPEEEEEEEDEGMEDEHDLSNEENAGGEGKVDEKSEKTEEMEKDEQKDTNEGSLDTKPKLDTDSNKEAVAVKAEKKETSVAVVDKALLEAFRFFDRNRVGFIRVEDLRLIIHNLGTFMSHRDVKELVQSALLESNTGRDDRILYNKLVRMSDI